jgi:hypothetical protein
MHPCVVHTGVALWIGDDLNEITSIYERLIDATGSDVISNGLHGWRG